MPRELKIFNGRGDYGYNDLDGHLYVCATSKAEAVRLLIKAGYTRMTIGEFNTYWHKNAWGRAMDGITPEIGVWFVPKEHEYETGYTPKRLL
jgi:hypothetical protein